LGYWWPQKPGANASSSTFVKAVGQADSFVRDGTGWLFEKITLGGDIYLVCNFPVPKNIKFLA
jgi:hypothetical protein